MTEEQKKIILERIHFIEADFETLLKGSFFIGNENIVSILWRNIGYLRGAIEGLKESSK